MIRDTIIYLFAAVGIVYTLVKFHNEWTKVIKAVKIMLKGKKEEREELIENTRIYIVTAFFAILAVILMLLFVPKSAILSLPENIGINLPIQHKCQNITQEVPEDPECAILAYRFDKECKIPGEFQTLARDKHHAYVRFCLWLHAEAQANTLPSN